MTFRVLATVVIVVWVCAAATRTGAGAQATKSTWDGVYSEEQATRGLETYTKSCSECHGADLGGDGFAPGLSGPEFQSAWSGLSLGDLMERIRVSMPPTDPGAVPVAGKADIIAYLLKANKFPAGADALPAEMDALKQIEYKATK
jgi:mono/diheme cytochrome c family protein